MKTAQQQLQAAVGQALSEFDISGVAADTLRVVPCANPQFGDYQWNGALPLARHLRQNPRALAQQVLSTLHVEQLCELPEIAGPGFINFRLTSSYIEQSTLAALHDPRLGVPITEQPRRVIIDYPSPNVAKPLHVGHIRTMFIGDAIARTLRFAGHVVISDNHVGDWGTPIGKVLLGWKLYRDEKAFARAPLEEMGRLYKLVNAAAEADDAVAASVRSETVKLQQGDSENLGIWTTIREASQRELDLLYEQLGIRLDVTLGESFYQPMLPEVVRDLTDRGLAHESQGALIVAFDEPKLRDRPMLLQKSDGAALYATTDLATIRYRMDRWEPDEIIYVVDARQTLHFEQVFATAHLWGYHNVLLRHITFGSILGDDGRPLKTRTGDSVALQELLDEATARTLQAVTGKNEDLPSEQALEVARVLGIGAIKYADLSPNRTSDYTFSWDKMLALNGNTAPYLLNAYVRIQSIFRKSGAQGSSHLAPETLHFELESEFILAKHILQFALAIETALVDYRPNALTDYLFGLAHKFHGFYEQCPVLSSAEPARGSRLVLCRLTGEVLRTGLNLLGIETVEQM